MSTEGRDAMTTTDNIGIVRAFIEAWSRLDPDELAGYFTDDGCYHNMPVGPVAGRDQVRDMIAAFTAEWTSTQWDLLNIVGSGDVVMAERLDRTRAGDKAVDLPCTGVFEMENGKIKVWRDYFDLSTFANAMR
jgi:limonene-1,2-epoxide hydrolase